MANHTTGTRAIVLSMVVLTWSTVSCTAADSSEPPELAPRLAAQSSGCLYPATLEITAINIGQGDATLIATPSSLVLADSGESYWNSHADAEAIDRVVSTKYGCRNLDYVVISHLQIDHIGYVGYGGLWYLANVLGYNIGATLLRDYKINVGTTSGTYDNWVSYLDTPTARGQLNPRTAVVGERLDLGAGIALTITSVDTRTASCPDGWGSKQDLSCGGAYVWPSEVLGDHRGEAIVADENDFSVGFVISVGDFDMFVGGDTNGRTEDSGFGTKRHDVESYLAGEVGEVDVLRVSHHGSDHSTNATFISQTSSQAAIISVGNANTYGHPRQAAIDRLLGVVDGTPTLETRLYLTERGDDGPGGCGTDYASSDEAAAELYDRATIAADTDGDPCTIEGGDVDIVVDADGGSFVIDGVSYTSRDAAPAAVCGNGSCETGEDCTSCVADCPAASSARCGNGVCEIADGEDCLSCPEDCAGELGGKPSKRFCCGAGAGPNPIGCDDSRCASDGLSCLAVSAPTCCGDDCGQLPPLPPPPSAPPACDNDGVCESGEDCNSCSHDCAGTFKGKPAVRYCCGNGEAEGPELGDPSICDGEI